MSQRTTDAAKMFASFAASEVAAGSDFGREYMAAMMNGDAGAERRLMAEAFRRINSTMVARRGEILDTVYAKINAA